MLKFLVFDRDVRRPWSSTLLFLVVALAMSRGASGSAQRPLLGMVESPCLELPARPRELDARTDREMRPEEPDSNALAQPLEAATNVYLAAQDEQRKQDWPNVCRYQADNIALITQKGKVRAVFLGDSITENWLVADPSLFRDGIVNRGIGGQTSPQMLLRVYADVLALHPRVVHIMAGTNDLAGNTGPTSAQQYKNNIMAMCDLAIANGVHVVLASIPPTVGFPWRAELRPGAQVVELNAWLRHYATHRKLVFVDYYAVLADANGAMRADSSHDGVHPHRTGYGLMRPLAEQAIAAAAKGR